MRWIWGSKSTRCGVPWRRIVSLRCVSALPPAQVGQRPDHKADATALGDSPDKADLRREVVFDRKACGEHQVARTWLDFGGFHAPDPLDRAVEAILAGDELGLSQHRMHRLPYGWAGL